MQVRNFQNVLGDIGYPVINTNFSARGAEAGLAREGDTMLILAAGAYPAGVTALRIAAEQHALNDVSDISLLIEGDLVGQAEVAVTVPMVEEYLAKAVKAGGVVERLPGGEIAILKGGMVFDCEVSD
jgi:hypothetical protein